MKHRRRVALKRVIDTSLILLASPVALILGGFAATCVRLKMGGPVLFRQTRIGLNERPFEVLKFRTMRNAFGPDGKALSDRERLTGVGRFLRKTSLDELPQLWNVVRGDMSLVGPRPLLPEYLPFYRAYERARHTVRPGITGAAQTAGRNSLLWDDRLQIDAHYAREGTIRDDVRILGDTFVGVFKPTGVSVVAGDTGEPLHVARGYPSVAGRTMRRLEVVDAQTRVKWFSDPRVQRTMNVPRNITVDGTAEWIISSRRTGGRRDYVLVDEAHGRVLAMMGTRRSENEPAVEVYVVVDPDMHGQGIGTSAMDVLLRHLRTEPHFAGAWLTVAPDNEAAIRLYRKFGFREAPQTGAAAPDTDGSAPRLRMDLSWGGANHE